jgi:hypothetical protein
LYFFVLAVALTMEAQASEPKLVDPKTVAPEYREAAEKRRSEQLRQRDCANKADAEKVLQRERATFINHCLETVGPK